MWRKFFSFLFGELYNIRRPYTLCTINCKSDVLYEKLAPAKLTQLPIYKGSFIRVTITKAKLIFTLYPNGNEMKIFNFPKLNLSRQHLIN